MSQYLYSLLYCVLEWTVHCQGVLTEQFSRKEGNIPTVEFTPNSLFICNYWYFCFHELKWWQSLPSQRYNIKWPSVSSGNHTQALNFDPRRRPRRQDWEGELYENGMFYIAKAEVIMRGLLQGERWVHVHGETQQSICTVLKWLCTALWSIISDLYIEHCTEIIGLKRGSKLSVTYFIGWFCPFLYLHPYFIFLLSSFWSFPTPWEKGLRAMIMMIYYTLHFNQLSICSLFIRLQICVHWDPRRGQFGNWQPNRPDCGWNMACSAAN